LHGKKEALMSKKNTSGGIKLTRRSNYANSGCSNSVGMLHKSALLWRLKNKTIKIITTLIC
jgi:hypothetical protein